jgi:nitroreductase
LSKAAHGQKHVSNADTVVVALGDPMEPLSPQMKIWLLTHKMSSTRDPSIQDPIMAVEHIALAAVALGYGACWIGAFDDNEVKKFKNTWKSESHMLAADRCS